MKLQKLYEAIAHGDKEHREWLWEALFAFENDGPIPEYKPKEVAPIPLLLTCPAKGCGERHIDEGIWATKPHHTHSCQHCGHTWRHAIVNTVGVQFLPGFKNEK